MLSPEDQQIQICLLKSNLEEIGNSLVVQRSMLPQLDAENELQYRETMSALKVSRAQNNEIERLKQENVRLAAKRTQLKRKCESLANSLEKARQTKEDTTKSLKSVENDEENNIRNYENSLQEKAERFRRTRSFYNEEAMVREFEQINCGNSKLEADVLQKQEIVTELRQELEALEPNVPGNLPEIMGKLMLEEKVRKLNEYHKGLQIKLNAFSY